MSRIQPFYLPEKKEREVKKAEGITAYLNETKTPCVIAGSSCSYWRNSISDKVRLFEWEVS
jgi:hypothetical protein